MSLRRVSATTLPPFLMVTATSGPSPVHENVYVPALSWVPLSAVASGSSTVADCWEDDATASTARQRVTTGTSPATCALVMLTSLGGSSPRDSSKKRDAALPGLVAFK